jgi:hypothetical protein
MELIPLRLDGCTTEIAVMALSSVTRLTADTKAADTSMCALIPGR